MNKLISFFILIVLLITITGCTQQVSEQTEITANVVNTPSCPRGIEHDSYPGQCGLYQDANSDGYCDLGE